MAPDTNTIHRRGTRIVALIAAGAIAFTGLVATPAAASAATAVGEIEVDLEGALRVVADESGENHGDTVTLITEAGAEIELAGDELEGASSGDLFKGTITVEGDAAVAVAEADTAADVEEAVAEHQNAPLEVSEAAMTPAVQAAVAAASHFVDVIYLAPAGHAQPTVPDIDAAITRLSDFWRTQSNGQVSGISRPTAVRYATLPNADLCNANAVWAYAAGPNGFNRTGPYGTPESYYWSGGNRTHLLAVVPGDVCGSGTGLGTVGNVHAGGLTWSSVDEPSRWDQVVFHEVGHNLGLGHSNVTECALPAVEGPTCTQHEYYDFYDVMGGGMNYAGITNFHDIASLNVTHKMNLDALTRSGANPSLQQVSAAGGATQQFTLNANGLDSGPRGLEVINPDTGERTFVEYRSAVGRDSNAFYKRVRVYTDVYSEGVRILRSSCTTLSGGCSGATSTVIRNSVDGRRLSYTAGQTYTAAGATPPFEVHVVGTSGTTATVRVTFNSAPAEFDGPTPIITGAPQVGSTLTVNPGSWPAQTQITYQWFANGAPVTGATAVTFTPRPEDVSRTITVTATGTLNTQTASKTSAPTGPVAPGTLKAGNPTIAGTPAVGSTLTANPNAAQWTAGTSFTYQWLAGGVPVPAATGTTFTPGAEDAGKQIRVRVTGTRTGYTTATAESALTRAASNGTLTAPNPTISGEVKTGSTLTVNPGTWTAGAALTYQWAVGGVDVPGATGNTFALTPDHAWKPVTVKVTGSLAGYTTVTRTASTVTVAGEPTSPAPTITGIAQVGGVLTANPGAWPKGTQLVYQWTANGVAIQGATANKLTLTAALAGKTLTVQVTATYKGNTTTTEASIPTSAVLLATLATAEPSISGTAVVGTKLIAYGGTWTFGTRFTYQWLINGDVIPGQTESTLLLTADHVGGAITVDVTGTLAGYAPTTMTSPVARQVAEGILKPSTPIITGASQVGQALTADPVSKGTGITHAFQWEADGRAIDGATGATYRLTAAERGKRVTVTVTYNKPGYTPVPITSSMTKAVS